MNYVRHLNTFFSCLHRDDRLTAFHISLYIALFQLWNRNHFQNPFIIQREELMQLSKIGSKNTYYKCLKELHQAGYIKQHPAPVKYMPVKITVIRLDKEPEGSNSVQGDMFIIPVDKADKSGTASPINGTSLVPHVSFSCPKSDTDTVPNMSQPCPKNGTGTVLNMGHLIKQNNKHINREEESPANVFQKNHIVQEGINHTTPLTNTSQKEETGNAGAELNPIPTEKAAPIKPLLLDVQLFFQQHNYPELEAQKFFHHYQCNGWLVGGKTPMQNWQSSAHSWMLRVKDFSKGNQVNTHNISNQKNYSEPL